MRKIKTLLIVLVALSVSCEGDVQVVRTTSEEVKEALVTTSNIEVIYGAAPYGLFVFKDNDNGRICYGASSSNGFDIECFPIEGGR